MFLNAVVGEPYPVPKYSDIPGVTGPYYGAAPSITPTATYETRVTKGGKTVTVKKQTAPIAPTTAPQSLPIAPTGGTFQEWLEGEVYFAGRYWSRKRLAAIGGAGILAAVVFGALRK